MKNLGRALFFLSVELMLLGCSTIPKKADLDYHQKKLSYDVKKPNPEDSYEYNKFFPGIYPEKPEIKIPFLRFRF